MTRITHVLMGSLLIAILSCATYAYASSAHVVQGGEGASMVSGYAITDIEYHLAATDPSIIDAVEFDLDRPAVIVQIAMVSTAPTYYPCLQLEADHWRCDVSPVVSVNEANELRVIASGN